MRHPAGSGRRPRTGRRRDPARSRCRRRRRRPVSAARRWRRAPPGWGTPRSGSPGRARTGCPRRAHRSRPARASASRAISPPTPCRGVSATRTDPVACRDRGGALDVVPHLRRCPTVDGPPRDLVGGRRGGDGGLDLPVGGRRRSATRRRSTPCSRCRTGGLCDAVIWMPAAALPCAHGERHHRCGHRGEQQDHVKIPAAASTSAAARANSSEWWRASRPTTTVGAAQATVLEHLATAQLVRNTTATFIPSGPSRIGPRRPAVPKVSGARTALRVLVAARRQFGSGLGSGS